MVSVTRAPAPSSRWAAARRRGGSFVLVGDLARAFVPCALEHELEQPLAGDPEMHLGADDSLRRTLERVRPDPVERALLQSLRADESGTRLRKVSVPLETVPEFAADAAEAAARTAGQALSPAAISTQRAIESWWLTARGRAGVSGARAAARKTSDSDCETRLPCSSTRTGTSAPSGQRTYAMTPGGCYTRSLVSESSRGGRVEEMVGDSSVAAFRRRIRGHLIQPLLVEPLLEFPGGVLLEYAHIDLAPLRQAG